MFNILPVFVEIILVIGAIGYLYPPKFFWMNLAAMLFYLAATFIATEWRAKFFKIMTQKDAAYVQKATDSLLNFETVKYFNAESHEQRRFQVALMEYKKSQRHSRKVLGWSKHELSHHHRPWPRRHSVPCLF